MWCAGCQTDVAGELSADGQILQCVSCGREVSSVRSLSLHPKTREVRDLLERWSTEELLDPDLPLRHVPTSPQASPVSTPTPTPTPEAPPSIDALAEAPALRDEARGDPPTVPAAELSPTDGQAPVTKPKPQRTSRPKYRLDSQHTPKTGSEAPVPAPHPRRAPQPAPQTRLDSSHAHTPAPHFNIASAFDGKKAPGRGESLWGQILAYGGIGLLTVGTVMVLWGYFGGPDNYTPTGWLLATAGQMLLFLGVVTLVSGGMEQTTHEVSRRIQVLGDQIVRIERHTQEQFLSGPHFAHEDESGVEQRKTADAPRHGSADA